MSSISTILPPHCGPLQCNSLAITTSLSFIAISHSHTPAAIIVVQAMLEPCKLAQAGEEPRHAEATICSLAQYVSSFLAAAKQEK